MKKTLPNRHAILLRSLLTKGLVFCFFVIGIHETRGDQSFVVALPELEGPLTLGIFSKEGALVRLLYRDASVESIPAGLNGLIMTWDEKDDQGRSVPAGNYMAKGLVHGPLSVSSLPFSEPITSTTPADWHDTLDPMSLQENSFKVRAPKDTLHETRPWITVALSIREHDCTLTVEGLPVISVPLNDDGSQRRIRIVQSMEEGRARLLLESHQRTSIYEIAGLDRLVPLSAGKLSVLPDAFHSSQSAGESTP
jgi:hypothetical protein